MGATKLADVYRTDEGNNTFTSQVTITYYRDTAHLHGLSGRFGKAQYMELYNFLKKEGVKTVVFYRAKKGKDITVHL